LEKDLNICFLSFKLSKDFGDFQFGDPFYDMIEMHIGCFNGRNDLLKLFLEALPNVC
jgi:hypothetical protein